MAVRRRAAGVCGSHRGLREQQFVIVTRRPPPRRPRRQRPAASTRTRHERGAPVRADAERSSHGAVPAIKSKGTLTVASDASYAPNEFFAPDGHTVIGMDADLSNALAAVMGLKAKVVNETFDSIIPGLASSKYDMGASSFTDTKAREKIVNFVDYFAAGDVVLSPRRPAAPTSLAWPTSAARPSRWRREPPRRPTRPAQSVKCKKAGKPNVNVLTFPDQNGANLALSSGRAQLGLADSPVADYRSRSPAASSRSSGTTIRNAALRPGRAEERRPATSRCSPRSRCSSTTASTSILTKWGIAERRHPDRPGQDQRRDN